MSSQCFPLCYLFTDTVGVGFTVHNSATLFPSSSDNGVVASDIVAANIAGVNNLNNLQDPVMIEFVVSL